jgi:hypothetical protein
MTHYQSVFRCQILVPILTLPHYKQTSRANGAGMAPYPMKELQGNFSKKTINLPVHKRCSTGVVAEKGMRIWVL